MGSGRGEGAAAPLPGGPELFSGRTHTWGQRPDRGLGTVTDFAARSCWWVHASHGPSRGKRILPESDAFPVQKSPSPFF